MHKQNKIIFYLFIIAILVAGVGFEIFVRQGYVLVKKTNLNQNATTTELNVSEVSNTVATTSLAEEREATTTESETIKQSIENDTKSALYIGKKVPDDRVSIDVAILEEDGFIVIYENTPEPTGEVIGLSMYLPAGQYTDIPIVLSREVLDGEMFDVMLHKDNNDMLFNLVDDVPLRGKNGNSVHAKLIIQSLLNISR